MSSTEKASLVSARQPNASLWLTVIPTEPAYRLNSNEMRDVLRMRLHLPPVPLDQLRTTVCRCSKEDGDLNKDPLHFQACKSIQRTFATKRHDLIVQVLKNLATDLQVPCDVEQRSTELLENRKKPDLRFTLAHHRLVSLVSDVAITHPATSAAADLGASQVALHAAARAESGKIRKYLNEHQPSSGIQFIPFVLESYGAWGRKSEQVLQQLMKRADDEERRERTIDAHIRISVALQRGNALMHRAGIELLESDRNIYVQLQLASSQRRLW